LKEEVIDEDGKQERPPGINMIPLPYADDIRAAPVEEALRGKSMVIKDNKPESDNGLDLIQLRRIWFKPLLPGLEN
jgi:ATP-dependent DNA helicase 2 subunit 1